MTCSRYRATVFGSRLRLRLRLTVTVPGYADYITGMRSRTIAIPLVLLVMGCSPKHETPPPTAQPPKFSAEGSVLYRDDERGRVALLALDSATAPQGAVIAPSMWSPQPGSTFGVAAKTFRHTAVSPDARWVAWESAGAVHDLLGVVPGAGGKLTVLDFYFDSGADSLRWTSNTQLSAYYMPPSGQSEVRVYDAVSGKRIR